MTVTVTIACFLCGRLRGHKPTCDAKRFITASITPSTEVHLYDSKGRRVCDDHDRAGSKLPGTHGRGTTPDDPGRDHGEAEAAEQAATEAKATPMGVSYTKTFLDWCREQHEDAFCVAFVEDRKRPKFNSGRPAKEYVDAVMAWGEARGWLRFRIEIAFECWRAECQREQVA